MRQWLRLIPFLLIGFLCFLSIEGVGAQSNSVHNLISPDHTLIWPVRGAITRGFLPDQEHWGIDISGVEGTAIVAAAGGEVVYAGWDDWGLGNAIKIKHPDNYYTVYGHNQRLVVQLGEQVEQGETIAYLGNTGFSDRPHLHFEVRSDDHQWLDPLKLLGSVEF